MNIDHYTVSHISGDGSPAVTQLDTIERAWSFMRELDRIGVVAGFPKAIFK
jgi:hypothetical protein